MTIVVTQLDDIHVRTNLLAAHHILYTLSIFMNVVTVIVYWTLLHGSCLIKYASPDASMDLTVKCYLNHIVPAIVCAANSLLTNCKLSTKFIPVLVFVFIFYGGINCYTTKSRGKPVYNFLTW